MTRVTQKLNKVELEKLQKDGLDVLDDIYRYAEAGDPDAITPDDLNRFKWYGLYHDRPKNGFFMLRIRCAGGVFTAEQCEAVADLAATVALGRLELTTRQTFQLHTIALKDIPHVFDVLQSVGLNTVGACGDIPRNVVSSPIAGIAADEWIDPRPFYYALNDHFENNRDYSNLPRKYKVTVAGGGLDATQAPINDLAFTPGRLDLDGETVLGFNVHVGGGLSHEPHLSLPIDVFVPADEAQVVEIARAVTLIFRDWGYRENRKHARLKYLIADWGAERFRDEVVNYVGRPLLHAATDVPVSVYTGDVVGVHPQQQPDLFWVGLLAPSGRITHEQLRETTRLARKYGTGEVRLTLNQNLLIPHVHNTQIGALLAEPLLQELKPNAPSLQRHAVACTALPYCVFATIETKQPVWELAAALDEKLNLDVPIRLHMSACPNSCSQHSVADIGLQGGLVRNPDGPGKLPAVDIMLGGALGDDATISRRVATKVKWDELAERLYQLLNTYQQTRSGPEQSFYAWTTTKSDADLRYFLGFDNPDLQESVWAEEGSWNKIRRPATMLD